MPVRRDHSSDQFNLTKHESQMLTKTVMFWQQTDREKWADRQTHIHVMFHTKQTAHKPL